MQKKQYFCTQLSETAMNGYKNTNLLNMKRFFIVLILAIAGIGGVKAQDDDERAFIKEFIESMDQELASLNGDGMYYNGTTVEGKNIICSVYVDESEFDGIPMKQAFALAGIDENTFAEMMSAEMYKQDVDEDEIEALLMLSLYGYKIYFRLIGTPSGERMNCLIDYGAAIGLDSN